MEYSVRAHQIDVAHQKSFHSSEIANALMRKPRESGVQSNTIEGGRANQIV
jgi:hypothetical protein